MKKEFLYKFALLIILLSIFIGVLFYFADIHWDLKRLFIVTIICGGGIISGIILMFIISINGFHSELNNKEL